MIKRPVLGSRGLSFPQITLILMVGLLAIAMVVLTLYNYFSITETATRFEGAGYATTNLSNIQREALLLHIETHALFSDPSHGSEPVDFSDRDFKPVDLRRDFLSAQLRVATAQVAENPDAVAKLDIVKSTLADYDRLLAFVRANPTLDVPVAIAQFDEVLIRLGLQVKALYDQQEVQFFLATAASLGAQKSVQSLLLLMAAILLALSIVLAASLRQSVRAAFQRVVGALEGETKERRRIEEAERSLVEELSVVDDIARTITSTLDIEQVYEKFASETKRLVDFDRASIHVIDHDAGVNVTRYDYGLRRSGHPTGLARPSEGSQTQHVLETGMPLIRPDIGVHPRFRSDGDYLKMGLRSSMVVPLISQGRIVGTLSVRSRLVNAYGPREQRILERLANQIAPAIENADLYEQTRQAEDDLRITNESLELRVQERTQVISQINTALKEEITEHTKTEAQLNQSRQQLRALFARLQSVREEERTTLAREIHDELGQALTGMKLELSWISRRLAVESSNGSNQSIQERIYSMSEAIDSSIQSVRTISTNLRPSVLDNLGLEAAIEWQAHEFQTRTGIATQVDLPPEDHDLKQEKATSIFRILQEALTNVARHSNATLVSIKLEQNGGNVILEVEDNGIGIKQSEISDLGSIGLLGMRERALQLGGEVNVSGVPGHGTIVQAWIPISERPSVPNPIPENQDLRWRSLDDQSKVLGYVNDKYIDS